jgi:hypothetical protein
MRKAMILAMTEKPIKAQSIIHALSPLNYLLGVCYIEIVGKRHDQVRQDLVGKYRVSD